LYGEELYGEEGGGRRREQIRRQRMFMSWWVKIDGG
jgi:hypothetical protein